LEGSGCGVGLLSQDLHGKAKKNNGKHFSGESMSSADIRTQTLHEYRSGSLPHEPVYSVTGHLILKGSY
jgi:hypothetical protein